MLWKIKWKICNMNSEENNKKEEEWNKNKESKDQEDEHQLMYLLNDKS